MIVLTDEQFDAEFENSLAGGMATDITTVDNNEELNLYSCPLVTDGCDRSILLRPGLRLRIWSFKPLVDLRTTDEENDDKELNISFFVKGDMASNLPGVAGEVEELAGSSYVMHCPGILETEWWKANRSVLRVKVIIDPVEFISAIEPQQLAGLPSELKQFILKGSTTPFYFQGKITTDIQSIIQQILNCPFKGVIRQWYLESKALELLSLQLHQLQTNADNRSSGLQSFEVDKIHQAKEVLIENYIDPPSVLELSETVNLYHMKLKQGFREIFGQTPFAFLRNYRLERARMMLSEQELTVTAISNRVGYSNPGHFAAAFKRKYGVTPGQYRT